MLDLVIGLAAALLVAVGVLIIAGPSLPRRLRALAPLARHLVERLFAPAPPALAAPSGDLHPTTLKAIAAADELALLLRGQREEALAGELRSAVRKIGSDEGRGLLALHAAARRVRGLHIGEAAAQERVRQLAMRVRVAVADRAEQLELLPFR